MSGETGDTGDWATAVVVVLRRFLYDLGRFSDENGLTGILRDDLGSTPLDADDDGSFSAVPVEDLRPSRLDRNAVALLL